MAEEGSSQHSAISRQPDSRTHAEPVGGGELIPLAMLNAFVYCPRRFHYEFVQGVMQDNEHVVHGRRRHARVDDPALAERPRREGEAIHTRSVWLASDRLGLTGKVDVVEETPAPTTGKIPAPQADSTGCKPVPHESGQDTHPSAGQDAHLPGLAPVEYKKSRPPTAQQCPAGYWPNDGVQVCAQALLLEEDAGHPIERGYLYFAATRQRVEVTMTLELRESTLLALAAARALCDQDEEPPPLVDSPTCPACSLVSLCMPDETNRLRNGGAGIVADPTRFPVPGEPLRCLIPADYDTEILYVTEQGATIGKTGDAFIVRDREGKKLTEAPGAKLRQICVYGYAQLTTQAVHACMDSGIDVAFLSMGGRLKGHLSPLPNPNGLLRCTVARALQSESVRLALAREVVAAKIHNQRVMLMRNTRPEDKGTAFARDVDDLQRLEESAGRAETRPALLGMEGSAARLYFGRLTGMLRPEAREQFAFTNRNRRPPRDPVNALLSLAYSCLCKDVLSAVAAVGLDPYLGALHESRRGQPALALDLMEEFRPIIADSVVLTLVNNRMLGDGDFVRGRQSCNLTDNGRRAFFAGYERRKADECTHPVFDYKTSYVRLVEMQARVLARFLTGQIPTYAGFRTR